MNGSLTLLDDNLLYIAFSIIGLSGKNEQKMKFRGRGVGQKPNRSLNPRLDNPRNKEGQTSSPRSDHPRQSAQSSFAAAMLDLISLVSKQGE